ncbi:conserved Plasmodium protein, unknown function [Plasmodium malariae]|uniref:Uncharacterized protein n=1 Tax=Plasmodium malariae TaxID=5858 RepID=A0A1D3SNY8_PLAMA|nr:conserved Plasmodium protein, unknown function [Plasmodium malariae]SCO93617.1 conserved Plasmodium protein, unknown function [Plasmodium malariae]
MNIKDDESENVVNSKNLKRNTKRNFENFRTFNDVESLSSVCGLSSNKRSNVTTSKDKKLPIYDNKQFINDLCPQRNKRKLEINFDDITRKQQKKKLSETPKNYSLPHILLNSGNVFASHEINEQIVNNSINTNGESLNNNAFTSEELLLKNESEVGKNYSNELSIIPFEGNNNNYYYYTANSFPYYKCENNSVLSSNINNNNTVKNILSILSKKDIFYKNVLKNQLKNNKPLMIKCDQLNLLLGKYKCENENSNNNFFMNKKNSVSVQDDSYELWNDILNNSDVTFADNSTLNLNPTNNKQNIPFFLNNNDKLGNSINDSYLYSISNESLAKDMLGSTITNLNSSSTNAENNSSLYFGKMNNCHISFNQDMKEMKTCEMLNFCPGESSNVNDPNTGVYYPNTISSFNISDHDNTFNNVSNAIFGVSNFENNGHNFCSSNGLSNLNSIHYFGNSSNTDNLNNSSNMNRQKEINNCNSKNK